MHKGVNIIKDIGFTEYKFNDVDEYKSIFWKNQRVIFEPSHYLLAPRLFKNKPPVFIVNGNEVSHFVVFAFSRKEIYSAVAEMSSLIRWHFYQHVSINKMLYLDGFVHNGLMKFLSPRHKECAMEEPFEWPDFEYSAMPQILIVTNTDELLLNIYQVSDVFNFKINTLLFKVFTTPGKGVSDGIIWYDGFTGIKKNEQSKK